MDHHRNGQIIVGVDGSLPSLAAAEWAAATAASLGAALTVLHVRASAHATPTDAGYGGPSLPPDLHSVAAPDPKLDASVADLRSMHPEVSIEGVDAEGRPGTVLAERTQSAELVVLGCHGHAGLGRLLGSVADEVVTSAGGPVAVVPPGSVMARGPVVVGVDDHAIPAAVVRFAAREAARLGVDIEFVHAVDYRELWGRPAAELNRLEVQDRISEMARSIQESIRPHLDQEGVDVRVNVARGPAAQALVEASQRASEIVVGSRGRGGFHGLLLGSTSREVVQLANCPVVVLPSLLRRTPASSGQEPG